MPNFKEDEIRFEALKNMLNDQKKEAYSHADISALIDAELEKDADAMDTDLIDELLKLLDSDAGIEADAQAKKAAIWDSIYDKLSQSSAVPEKQNTAKRRTKASGFNKFLRVAAIIVATCIVIPLVSVGVGYAFNWKALIRLFAPFMETIGIRLNMDSEPDSGELEKSGESEVMEVDIIDSSETITDYSAVPDTIDEVSIKPAYIPEGYAFEYAEVFNGKDKSVVLMVFSNGDKEMFIRVMALDNRSSYVVQQIEKAPESLDGETGNTEVVLVTDDFGMTTATYATDMASYSAWGYLSDTDLVSVINSF